jgi:hypothetical protein
MRKRDLLDIAPGRSLAASGPARSIRESAKVSQSEVASAIGVSASAPRNTERQAGHHRVAFVIDDLVSLDPFVARPMPRAAIASSAEVARSRRLLPHPARRRHYGALKR